MLSPWPPLYRVCVIAISRPWDFEGANGCRQNFSGRTWPGAWPSYIGWYRMRGGGLPKPNVVKIDVEGGEYHVLRGGASLFVNQKPLIIAEVHHQQAAEQISTWLHEYRYCSQWDIPREGFPRRLFAWPPEYDGAAWMAKLLKTLNEVPQSAKETGNDSRPSHPAALV